MTEPIAAKIATITTLVAALTAGAASSALAEEYYVGTAEHGASDDNNGLHPEFLGGTDGPFATVGHATQTMLAGDTTYVRAGTYDESDIRFGSTGTELDPIVLTGYEPDGERPVIDGGGASAYGIYIAAGRNNGWVQPHFIELRGLEVSGMGYSGIGTEWWATVPYEGLVFEDLVVTDNGLQGMWLGSVAGFFLHGVEASHNGEDGIAIIGSSPSVGGELASTGGMIIDCWAHDNDERGISMNQTQYVEVGGNYAIDNGNHGFDVSDWPRGDDSTPVSHSIWFGGNVSLGNGSSGFSVNSWSHDVFYERNLSVQNNDAFRCYSGCWNVGYLNNTAADNLYYGFLVREPDGSAPPHGSFTEQFEEGEPQLMTVDFANNIAWNNGNPAWQSTPALTLESRKDANYVPIGLHPDEWVAVGAGFNILGTDAGDDKWVVGIGSADAELAAVVGGTALTVAEVNADAFMPGAGNHALDPMFVPGDYDLADGSPAMETGHPFGQWYCGDAPERGAIEVCE